MKTSIGAKDIVFPTPVFIVGTYCEDGKANAMNVAWGGICSSNPPCIAISIRKQRCSYENITTRKAFTINIPSEAHMKEADFMGITSGKAVDKFEVAGLTPIKGDHVDAPYIKEFPMNIECRLVDTIQIGEHTQFIGEVLDIKIDDRYIGNNGFPEIEKIKPMLFDPASNHYYSIGEMLGKAFAAGKEIQNQE